MPIDISVRKLDRMCSKGLPSRLKVAIGKASTRYLVKAEIWEDPATRLQHIRFDFIPEGPSKELPQTFTIVADRYPGFSEESLDNVAKQIEEWYDSKHPRTVIAMPTGLKVLSDVSKALAERGDFEIDVERLVDILLQLNIAKPKED